MLHYNDQLCELIHGNKKIINTLEHDIQVLETLIRKENQRTGKHVDPIHISYNHNNPVEQFDELLHVLQTNYNEYQKLHELPTKDTTTRHLYPKWLHF